MFQQMAQIIIDALTIFKQLLKGRNVFDIWGTN